MHRENSALGGHLLHKYFVMEPFALKWPEVSFLWILPAFQKKVPSPFLGTEAFSADSGCSLGTGRPRRGVLKSSSDLGFNSGLAFGLTALFLGVFFDLALSSPPPSALQPQQLPWRPLPSFPFPLVQLELANCRMCP